MPASETELVQQARLGQRDAFAALYNQHYRAIYTHVYYRVADPAAAEELTATVFVRMVEHIQEYRDQGKPFIAWLYTIARHLLADYYHQVDRVGQLPVNGNLATRTAGPEVEAEKHLAADCLARALRQLTEEQRQVIIGKFLEDRSNTEMAELMGKNEGSIKSLQHRALAALRRAIGEEGCYEP